MTKLKLYVFVLLLLSLLLTGCGINPEKNFYVDRMWFDSNNIYVRFTKSDAIYYYSPFNINGDLLTKEEKSFFTYYLPRNSIQSKTQINLEKGGVASSLVFESNSVKITAGVENATINLGTRNIPIRNCSSSIWSAQGAIKSGDKFFYCGIFFDETGNIIQKIPQSVIDKLTSTLKENSSGRQAPSLVPPVFDFAIADNQLLIASDYVSSSSVLKLAVWPIKEKGKLTWQNIVIPFPSIKFRIANHYGAYAPSGLILVPDLGHEWVLHCRQAGCKKINVNRRFEYLLFDNDTRELFVFTRETIGSPSLTVFKSKY